MSSGICATSDTAPLSIATLRSGDTTSAARHAVAAARRRDARRRRTGAAESDSRADPIGRRWSSSFCLPEPQQQPCANQEREDAAEGNPADQDAKQGRHLPLPTSTTAKISSAAIIQPAHGQPKTSTAISSSTPTIATNPAAGGRPPPSFMPRLLILSASR